jgi:hypothetical protein
MPEARNPAAGSLWAEAFTAGKDPQRPERNEDQFLILPGRAYAVIDGVTSIGAPAPGGLTTGRLGGLLVRRAVAEIVDDPFRGPPSPEALLAGITDRIAAIYRVHGLVERLAHAPKERFAATLALALVDGERLVIVLAGDSGARLNGREVHLQEPLMDRVLAWLRVETLHRLEARGLERRAAAALAREVTLHGLEAAGAALEARLGAGGGVALRDAVAARAAAELPEVPADEVVALLRGGIADGQALLQNRDDRALGYAVLDGFPVGMRWVKVVERPLQEVHTLELFSDGYFKLPVRPRLADWEAAADEVERLDPLKIGRYASTKGSLDGKRTDDRTVVIVTRDGRPTPPIAPGLRRSADRPRPGR